jgi:hypothetical protein
LRSRRSADYSAFDAWLLPLPADCSALHSFCLALTTDLTRCSTLAGLRRLRLAPQLAPAGRAGHGSLRARIAPRSALRTPHRYSLRHTRYLAFRVAHGLLQVRRFLLCAAHGLLRARRLALRAGLRIAPYSDTLRPRAGCGSLRACTQVPHRSQIALCPTLDASSGSRISPRSFLCAPCCSRMPPRSTLRVSKSTSDCSAFDSHSAPYSDCSVYDTWLFVPLTDYSALFT